MDGDEVSFYEVEDPEEEKTDAELERERIGADIDKLNLWLLRLAGASEIQKRRGRTGR